MYIYIYIYIYTYQENTRNTTLRCFAQVFGHSQDGQRCHLQIVTARSSRDAAIFFDRADVQLSQPIYLGGSATQLQGRKGAMMTPHNFGQQWENLACNSYKYTLWSWLTQLWKEILGNFHETKLFSTAMLVITAWHINHIQILSIDIPYTNHILTTY